MAIKRDIIQYLENNKGEFISGEDLAKKFSVTRSAIWKAINTLKKEGYPISSITNKGYSLSPSSDIVSSEGIYSFVKADVDISYYDTIDSTNKLAKKLAIDDVNKVTVVVAGEQTQGRGRRGHSFYSPKNSGIYLSIILKPTVLASQCGLITTMSAVAVANAIDEIANIKTDIKWINDIYYKDKKICGILAEAIGDFQSGLADYIIIGIGVNINTNDFPKEIQNKAGSICIGHNDFSKNELIAKIIDNIITYNKDIESRTFLSEYKNKCLAIGKEVEVIKDDKVIYLAKGIDIDDNGELVVQKNGERITLNNEEISIKINKKTI